MQARPHNIDIQATQLDGADTNIIMFLQIDNVMNTQGKYWALCLVSWSPYCLCWWLPWGQGSRQRGRGTLSIWWGEDSFLFHHLSSSKCVLFWPDMDTWRAKRGQQPCRLRKESEGRSRKPSWIFRSETRFLFFVVFHNIDHLQAFAGLNQTGVVDGKTREMMETPRWKLT